MPYLEIENLSLTLDGKKLLDNISFSAEKATITLIAGLNGSGKSLLLRSIKGLEKIDKGRICIEGREMARCRERMERIALVFQDTELQIVGTTVEKDIAFGPENQGMKRDEISRIVEGLLSEFSMTDKKDLYPEVLSGGERRKLCIMGVLAMSPSILLLDEPFANLDYPSTLTVIRMLDLLKARGMTVIIVSHEAEKFLAHTDRTLILEKGRVKVEGKSYEMMDALRENGIYLPKNASFKDLSWL